MLTFHKEYRFKNQPERLKFTGRQGLWNQFEKVGQPGVWAEVLDRDLNMIEEVPPPLPPGTQICDKAVLEGIKALVKRSVLIEREACRK